MKDLTLAHVHSYLNACNINSTRSLDSFLKSRDTVEILGKSAHKDVSQAHVLYLCNYFPSFLPLTLTLWWLMGKFFFKDLWWGDQFYFFTTFSSNRTNLEVEEIKDQ